MSAPGSAVNLLTRQDVQNLSVVYGKQNVIPWTWYDTLTVANGNAAQALQFFSRTRGADGLAITNMEAPNQLISGKLFVLESIMLDAAPVDGAFVAGTFLDLALLTESKASFTFKINQVEYAQDIVKALTGGMFGYGTPATDISYATPRVVKAYKLDPAIVIPTQTNFTLGFDYAAAPNPAASVVLRPRLCGRLIRLTSA